MTQFINVYGYLKYLSGPNPFNCPVAGFREAVGVRTDKVSFEYVADSWGYVQRVAESAHKFYSAHFYIHVSTF